MEPLGLLSLATVLHERGHEVGVLDLFPGDHAFVRKAARRFNPGLIGYGFESSGVAVVKDMHALLQPLLPDTVFCAGGAHTSVTPETVLRGIGVDFVFAGEGEEAFPSVVARLEDGGDITGMPGVGLLRDGAYVAGPAPAFVEDLDSLPMPNRDLLIDRDFYFGPPGNIRGLVMRRGATMVTSRGCPFRCVFCQSSAVLGHRVRQRGVERVVAEMRELHERYGVESVYFGDDIFGFDTGWLLAFCDRLARERLGLRWGCQQRADRVTDARLAAMKAAGCVQIDMGVESGDPRVLTALNKGETVEQFEDAARLVHRHGMRLLASFVVGSPDETGESIRLTERLIGRLRPHMCQYFTLVPYPGTALYDEALARGWVDSAALEGVSQKAWGKGVLCCGLSPDDQARARSRLQRKTFLRDHWPLVAGWLRFPGRLLAIVWVLLANGLFLGTLAACIRDRTPVRYMQTVYAEYNRSMLRALRRRRAAATVQEGEEGWSPA